MPRQSLRSKLFVTVSALVIGSGLLISLLVTQRYSNILFEAMAAQTENLAHALALEAADKILINDLIGLQKMLDHQMRSNPAVSYLFIVKEDRVLAHTFTKGVPVELTRSNWVIGDDYGHLKRIASTKGEHYLDIAWPIFSGKAGILRLGLSEEPLRHQVIRLWLQMSGITLGILLLALTGTLLFVRRITSPLAELAQATERIGAGKLGVRVQVERQDEVGRLAGSFNQMVARAEEYTKKLEEQTLELDRSHYQTKTSCRIVQEIGAMRSLKEICILLIKKTENVLKCNLTVLLIPNSKRDVLFAVSKSGVKDVRDPKSIQTTLNLLEGLTEVTFTKKMTLKPPIVPDSFNAGARQVVIPIEYENQFVGALLISCHTACQCDGKEIQLVGMILNQASGNIKRAVLQEEEMHDLRSRIEDTAEFCGIIGKDPKMQVIYKLIEDVSPTDASVLIQGETGTGKELVARAVHIQSLRKDRPFMVINCSAYPATLLESELFGHEKGAFTGAIRQKPGRFEQANGGTVFLDEVGEIALSAQIKLLRVLQSRKLQRIGGEKVVSVDVRIIAATNKDLFQEVEKGRFREDLLYRLNVIPILLPPLRERPNDIPILARHFLRKFAEDQGKDVRELSSEAMRLLLDYPWPGNVRELENSIEHATVLAKAPLIEVADLPSKLSDSFSSASAGSQLTIMENEKILLKETLERCNWNKKKAAQYLGISRPALYDKLKRYQITEPTVH
jgi:two-component system response regulator HydG